LPLARFKNNRAGRLSDPAGYENFIYPAYKTMQQEKGFINP